MVMTFIFIFVFVSEASGMYNKLNKAPRMRKEDEYGKHCSIQSI